MKFLLYFFSIVLVEIVIAYSIHYLFVGEQLYYQSFGEQIASERIDLMLELTKKYQWFTYLLVPAVILLRIFFTSFFLFIGILFNEMKKKYNDLLKIALFAEFVYVFSDLIKLVVLIFFTEVSTLEDIQFQPLSVMELLDKNKIDLIFVYPLSLLNVFEVLYFLTLAWLLKNAIYENTEPEPVSYGRSLGIVTVSYGSGLLLWVVIVMFITLNLS